MGDSVPSQHFAHCYLYLLCFLIVCLLDGLSLEGLVTLGGLPLPGSANSGDSEELICKHALNIQTNRF